MNELMDFAIILALLVACVCVASYLSNIAACKLAEKMEKSRYTGKKRRVQSTLSD